MLFSLMTWWPHCASISSLAGCWPKCLMRDMHSPYTYKACKWAADPHLFPQALIFFPFFHFPSCNSTISNYNAPWLRRFISTLKPRISRISSLFIMELCISAFKGVVSSQLHSSSRIEFLLPFHHVIMQSKPSRVQDRANSSLPWSLSTFSALYIL